MSAIEFTRTSALSTLAMSRSSSFRLGRMSLMPPSGVNSTPERPTCKKGRGPIPLTRSAWSNVTPPPVGTRSEFNVSAMSTTRGRLRFFGSLDSSSSNFAVASSDSPSHDQPDFGTLSLWIGKSGSGLMNVTSTSSASRFGTCSRRRTIGFLEELSDSVDGSESFDFKR